VVLSIPIKSQKELFREGERSQTDLEALHVVQTQLDSLIEELIATKVTVAGFSIGGYDVYARNNAKIIRQKDE
jgi:hypothetical protein